VRLMGVHPDPVRLPDPETVAAAPDTINAFVAVLRSDSTLRRRYSKRWQVPHDRTHRRSQVVPARSQAPAQTVVRRWATLAHMPQLQRHVASSTELWCYRVRGRVHQCWSL
jgi:hypothetical protein